MIKILETEPHHKPKRKTKGAAAYDCKCTTDLSKIKVYNAGQDVEPDLKEWLSIFMPHQEYKKYLKGEAYEPVITLESQYRLIIPLGFKVSFSPHLVAKIFLRSSLGFKSPLFIPNSVSVIDSDYRGEVGLILGTQFPTKINLRERLCQMTFEHLYYDDRGNNLELVQSLEASDRGVGGFGSTGKK